MGNVTREQLEYIPMIMKSNFVRLSLDKSKGSALKKLTSQCIKTLRSIDGDQIEISHKLNDRFSSE